MSFRPATLADEELFWEWREWAEAQPWYGGAKTTREQHGEWFRDRLERVTLLVWSYRGNEAGIVRVDSNGELAFESMLPRTMLEELLATWDGGRLKLTVDEADRVKALAAEAAGFRSYPVRFFCYRP